MSRKKPLHPPLKPTTTTFDVVKASQGERPWGKRVDPKRAQLVDGVIVPGEWFVSTFRTMRYADRARAERAANRIIDAYGPAVYQTEVREEPSRSRPGETSFQVYLRSMGAMESLISNDDARAAHAAWLDSRIAVLAAERAERGE